MRWESRNPPARGTIQYHIRHLIVRYRKSRRREIGVEMFVSHDDVIKWKHFPRYWPFVPGIHRSSVNSSHKGQWRGALMFSLICARINGRVNKCEAGDLRRYRAHYDVIVMWNARVALKFGWRLDSTAVETPAKFQNNWNNITTAFEILR